MAKDMFGNTIPKGGLIGGSYGLGNNEDKSGRDTRRQISTSEKNKVWDNQDGKCYYCGNTLKRASVQYDHKKGYAESGKTDIKNVVACCANCHAEKTNEDRIKKITKKPKEPRQTDMFGNPIGKKPKGLFGY